MALAPDMSIAITRPGNVFKGMCNVSIHRLLVVTQDGFLFDSIERY